MDESQNRELSWWEATIQRTVNAAVDFRFSEKRLDPYYGYQQDQNGRLVRVGQPVPGAVSAVPAGTSPLVLALGVAVVGLLIYKLVD